MMKRFFVDPGVAERGANLVRLGGKFIRGQRYSKRKRETWKSSDLLYFITILTKCQQRIVPKYDLHHLRKTNLGA